MANYTTIDKPSDYFETLLSTGDGGSQTFTGLDFQPDFVWSKRRQTHVHQLYDSVRTAGSGKAIQSDSNAAEGGDGGTYGYLSSFTSDGFASTVGSSNNNYFNADGATYVFWNWKAGTSFTNDASSTGIGGVDSAGSFNNAAGFSIVTYNGNAGNTTVKHGMNVAPKMIIFKRRDANSTNWYTYHASLGQGKRLVLNTTAAEAADTEYMNNTAPTTSVFSLGPSGTTNTTGNHLAYCFAEIKGYSKFGSYTGNGNANGTFVYTGQKSRFIMIKAASRTGTWNIYDTKRNPHNNIQDFHVANVAEADVTGNTYQNIDILSNGFKCYGTGSGTNESGATYIFMAFAENPFVTSTGIPATAR